MDITITSEDKTIAATGQSLQVVGTIQITNSSDAPIELGGTEAELEQLLGVNITDPIEGMSSALQFLFMDPSPQHKQFDLESESVEVVPGEVATIQIRLENPPGSTGTFKLNVGESSTTITAE